MGHYLPKPVKLSVRTLSVFEESQDIILLSTNALMWSPEDFLYELPLYHCSSPCPSTFAQHKTIIVLIMATNSGLQT